VQATKLPTSSCFITYYVFLLEQIIKNDNMYIIKRELNGRRHMSFSHFDFNHSPSVTFVSTFFNLFFIWYFLIKQSLNNNICVSLLFYCDNIWLACSIYGHHDWFKQSCLVCELSFFKFLIPEKLTFRIANVPIHKYEYGEGTLLWVN
jgi:hypothetical protein